MITPQLSLGTAQWGMDYGWANQTGRPSLGEMKSMLELALDKGVRCLDTAQGYGDSEEILGALGAAKAGFEINSKFDRIGVDTVGSSIREKLEKTLSALRVSRLGSLMVHDAQELRGPAGNMIWDEFRGFLSEGIVRRIGVSIYHPEELDEIINLEDLGIVQFPLNLYDQRFITAGWPKKLNTKGVVVQIRSVFLQGILTLPAESLPPHLRHIQEHHRCSAERLNNCGLSRVEGALRFCRTQPSVNQVIVGSETFNQLSEILGAWEKPCSLSCRDWESFQLDDLQVLDPSTWPQKQINLETQE